MTMRKRRSGRRGGTRRRTGRLVWVNENINLIPVENSTLITDLLSAAADFMTFDTTIVTVVITDLVFSYQVDVSGGLVNARFALTVARSLIDQVDLQTPFASSIGPPWLYVKGKHSQDPINSVVNQDFCESGPIIVRAKRRFKENNSTLWMHFQNVVEGETDISGVHLSGMTRTLLYIP